MKISLTSLFKKNKVNSVNQILHEISFNQNFMKKALLIISLKNEVIDEVLRGPISEALKKVGKKVEKQYPSLQVDFHGFSYVEISQIRHFRYRISSKKGFYGLHTNLTIKVTLQFIMIFSKNFMTLIHVEVKNGSGGQIGYQRNIETGMKDPLV